MAIEVIPVVEFEPSALGVDNFVELHNSGDWPAHWATLLSNYGMTPLQPGSWFVPLAQVTSAAALELLFATHVGDGDSGEGVGPLPGGYAIRSEAGVVEPGCCSDLSDLAAWAHCVQAREPEGPMLIGHGTFRLVVGPADTTLVIDSERAGADSARWKLNTPELLRGLEAAGGLRRAFQARLAQHLSSAHGAREATELAAQCVGTHDA